MTSETNLKVYREWIETILNEAEDRLSDWERNFIESISNQMDERGWISDKQVVVLERIYSSKTS